MPGSTGPAPSSGGLGGGRRGGGGQRALHLADSMESLNGQVGDMAAKCKGLKTDKLLKTTQTMLNQAKEAMEVKRDEELAYTYYMRYVNMYRVIIKRGEYARYGHYRVLK